MNVEVKLTELRMGNGWRADVTVDDKFSATFFTDASPYSVTGKRFQAAFEKLATKFTKVGSRV